MKDDKVLDAGDTPGKLPFARVRGRDPCRGRARARRSPAVAVGISGADGARLFLVGRARRALGIYRPGGELRPHRRPPRHGRHRRRAEQPAARRALRLRGDQSASRAVRLIESARSSARHRDAGGRPPARQGQALGRGVSGGGASRRATPTKATIGPKRPRPHRREGRLTNART